MTPLPQSKTKESRISRYSWISRATFYLALKGALEEISSIDRHREVPASEDLQVRQNTASGLDHQSTRYQVQSHPSTYRRTVYAKTYTKKPLTRLGQWPALCLTN